MEEKIPLTNMKDWKTTLFAKRQLDPLNYLAKQRFENKEKINPDFVWIEKCAFLVSLMQFVANEINPPEISYFRIPWTVYETATRKQFD